MSLRLKIALMGLPLFLVLFAALHLTASNVLVRSFDAMEMDAAVQEAATIHQVMHNAQSQLASQLKDWSNWDDTYQFIQDGNPDYIQSNLTDATFTNLRLSSMMFIDKERRIVCAKAFDLERNARSPVPQSLLRLIEQKNSPLYDKSGITGLIAVPDGLMLVGARPILMSDDSGPARGTILFTRTFTPKAIGELRRLTNTQLTLRRYQGERMPVGGPGSQRLGSGEPVLVKVLSREAVEADVLLGDLYGRPAIVLGIPIPRTIHMQGMASLRLLDMSIALLGIAFTLLSLFATDRLLLRRLSRLQGELNSIDVHSDLSRRMTVTGRDEMSSFASTVNDLLDSLQHYRDKDRAVLEAIPDTIVLVSADGVFLDLHTPHGEHLPYPPEYYSGKKLGDVLPPEIASLISAAMRKAEETGHAQIVEYARSLPDAEAKHFETRIVAIGDGSLLAIVRDISERKCAEANLRMQISAMNAASDQITISDAEGLIRFVNPAFERATGYSREEVIGKSASFLAVHKDDSVDADIEKTVRAGKTWHGEAVGRRKDGRHCPEDVTVTPVMNEAGVIEHCIAIKRDITDKKIYEARLDQLAHHDSLTGLPNRLLFSDRLTQRIAEARRRGEQLAVMFLDMDRFKLINDTLGHNAGDVLLQEVAERLKSTLRDVDTVARMGGDEFTVILSQVRHGDEAAIIGRRILEILSKPFAVGGHELFLTASIGISLFPSDGSDVETLVRNADAAMYHAKDQGRNTFHFYTEALNIAAVERMTLEAGLRKALERDELLAYYQPRVDVRTGEIVGTEALIRWQHPDLKLIAPAQFIPLAEETGLIVPMGEWMLRTACAQNKEWQESGLPPIEVGVNVSARQFQLADLLDTVTTTLRDTGMDPSYLVLELTESALMLNPEHAIRVLRDLKKLGVKVFIDDFGTGYSSLSHLKHFPIDAVKIDGSFIRGVTHDPDDAAIAGAIVAMAHSLKVKVIAEGVETLGQLDFLKSLDCDEMQGYFVSRPAPADDLLHSLQASSRLFASVR
jgi:diguanylate cyclase (GGDEF)-like protein/PAS domain S-box-containing protein